MLSKQEWEKKIQKLGFDAKLDEHSVLILKTGDREEAIRYRDALKEFPYSWGIQVKRNGQEEVLSDTEEIGECGEI